LITPFWSDLCVLLEVKNVVHVVQHVLSKRVVRQLALRLLIGTWQHRRASLRLGIEHAARADHVDGHSKSLLHEVLQALLCVASAGLVHELLGAILEAIVRAAGEIENGIGDTFGGGLLKIEQVAVLQRRVVNALAFVDGDKDGIHALHVIVLLGEYILVDAGRVLKECGLVLLVAAEELHGFAELFKHKVKKFPLNWRAALFEKVLNAQLRALDGFAKLIDSSASGDDVGSVIPLANLLHLLEALVHLLEVAIGSATTAIAATAAVAVAARLCLDTQHQKADKGHKKQRTGQLHLSRSSLIRLEGSFLLSKSSFSYRKQESFALSLSLSLSLSLAPGCIIMKAC